MEVLSADQFQENFFFPARHVDDIAIAHGYLTTVTADVSGI